MCQFVSRLQVGHGIVVDIAAEIIAVRGENTVQAVVVVQHAGDAVEAQAVEAELFQPEADITEEKPLHLEFGVVECQRVPRLMQAACPGVKILEIRAVKAVQALLGVFDRVAMDHVQQDPQAETVRHINQPL